MTVCDDLERGGTYLPVRVPHHVFDVLRVRVYDGDALVIVFFVH